jgi:glycosyltransferase involved in cell wall biosynthesis
VPADERLRLAFIGDPNSIHTRRWMSYFAQRGHEVFLLDPFRAAVAPGLDGRIRVERYLAHGRSRMPLLSVLDSRRALRRLLRRLRPDVLHAHFVRRYGWQGALAGFHPFVVSPWGSDLLAVPRHALRTRWWNRLALRAADLVTVTTGYLRTVAIMSGADPARVEIVQHGVDTARFSPGPVPQELAERLGVGDRAVIFSPRGIRGLYHHETVIAAFAQLPTDTALVMSKGGVDAAYLAALRSQIDTLGVGARAVMVDHIEHDEMPDYYRLARVMVSVPQTDSFPVSVMEAMACGTPVVASDLPPARAILGPIAPRFVVPLEDVAALASALRHALSLTGDERRRLGDELRAHVVRNADYESNMARMEDLYRRLAGRR